MVSLRAFPESPILGYGHSNYINLWWIHSKINTEVAEIFDHPHNRLMDVLSSTGAVGLIAYLALVLVSGYIAARNVVRGIRDGEAILPLVVILTFIAYHALSMIMVDAMSFAIHLGDAPGLFGPYRNAGSAHLGVWALVQVEVGSVGNSHPHHVLYVLCYSLIQYQAMLYASTNHPKTQHHPPDVCTGRAISGRVPAHGGKPCPGVCRLPR